MENFLKPFLEKGMAYSLEKAPICAEGASESNIKLIQKVIFKHDVLAEVKEELHSVCSTEPYAVKSDTVKKLIKRLHLLLLSDENVKVKTEIFCNVFKSFTASSKGEDSVPVLQFFVILSITLGINTVNATEDGNDTGQLISVDNFQTAFDVEIYTSPDSLLIFKELLACLSKTSINLSASEFQLYNKWLQHLVRNLANSQPFETIFLEIFLTVAYVDLKLLEGNLDYIFSSVLSQKLPDDESFWSFYGTFLESTLNICAKSQRAVKFITRFLSSIKGTSSVLVKEIILPSNVINEFSKTVKLASNQQSLSFFQLLTENVSECFNEISQNNSGFNLFLLVTSELLIAFFKEVKIFAPSIVSATLQMFINKLHVFKENMQKFGNYLFSNKSFLLKNQCIAQTFLELCYYCGEIQELVNCYKDSILQPSEVNESTADCDWQCCLSLEQWDKLVNFVLKSKLENCATVCFQLAIQHFRICRFENEILPTDDPTVKIILHQLSLNTFNVFEKLPPDDLTILTQRLTSEQSKLISKHILKQILENENKRDAATWLSNPVLQENSVFIASLFMEVLKETGSLLRNAVPEKNHGRLSWLSEEYFDDCNVLQEESVDRLPDKINQLLRNVKKMRKVVRFESKEVLIRLVEVFKLLPLPHMTDGFRRLGLSFAVGIGTFLTEDECLVFESICNFLASDMDASTCFDIGFCITWLAELSEENNTNDFKMKVIESLVRNSPNMKFGLNQMGEMIDSTDTSKHKSPLKMLETRVVLYNELGKCWQRAKKRKSDNDLIGSFRTKLARMISNEAKQLQDETINPGNCKILLKIVAIELNKAIKGNEEDEIASLAEQKFPPYFDFAVKNLKKEFDEPSAAFLTFTLQSLPQLRKFLPEDTFLEIWKALKTHEKVNWRLFCSRSNEKEFGDVLEDLLKMSKKYLSSESSKHSSNCFDIWVAFFESSTESKRSLCQLRLQELFKYVHECHLLLRDLPIKRKYSLIKFFSFCLNKKEVVVTSHVLDTVIHVILECLDETPSIEDFHSLFTLEAEVASAVLLKQFAWSKSKVHLTFVIYKRMLGSLLARCNIGQTISKEDVIKLSACAFCLEKWASLMVKKEKDFARTSAYFITALISSIASVTVLPVVKFHLVNSINHFLSISDSHTVAYLMRILKPGYQQVFNTVYNQFKKYHKYSGKI